MPPIGETLREARLRRNVDIAEVSTRTKIRTKYLRALENEEFDQLPGPTYVRTFLRTYAEFLGLDPHLLVEEYRRGHGRAAEEEALTPFAPTTPGRQREVGVGRPRIGPPGPGALIGGAVGAIIVIFLLIGVLTEPPVEQRPAQPAQTGSTEPSRPTTDKAPTTDEPKAKPSTVKLTVNPAGPTYLCVDDGRGTVVFEDTIDGPEDFKGRILRINMGNAQAQVETNGKPVKIEEGPNPVGYLFKPGKAKPLADGDRPCQ
jgi:cytoskeletal protein RodZ